MRLNLRRFALVLAAATGLLAGVFGHALGATAAGNTIWLATLVIGGGPLVAQTVLGAVRGRFAADIVASLAIIVALLLDQYFAGVVIVLMQSGGEALERFAMGRASESLDTLLARAPKVAHRMGPGGVEEVPVEHIRVGDTLLVRPGELIPVDATVVDGRSSVDQSAITGEPIPVAALPGTRLPSGALNLQGVVTLQAVRRSEESQYQQVVKLVEQARREKPPIQRLADRWAVWFTPLTLLVCAIAWWGTRNPEIVLSILVVATPCPLILATPVAVIAGISRAARHGVVVKTGAAIEQLGLARVVVFDKTGTLTVGRPAVAHVRSVDGGSPSEVLRVAASLEQFSSHHLARAITAAGREGGATLSSPSDVFEAPGSGVSGSVDGRAVKVGSASFLRAGGVPVDGAAVTQTTAYVAMDGRLVGSIEFADHLRPQVPELMRRLSALGVRDTVMLTGDRQSAANAVAAAAGIATVEADLLPSEKLAAVESLKRRHGVVAMVGDGINDAPALAAATVGIALGAHGTAAPASAADVVLLVDDVSRVADAVETSQRMRRIALQGLRLGLGASFVMMIFASFGLIPPAVGALLQEALDAAVILNALRAR
jgi:heavy metal translocating P-type ATPase